MNIILSLDFCLKRFLLKTFRVCLLLLRKVPNSFRWSLAPVACRVTLPLSHPPASAPQTHCPISPELGLPSLFYKGADSKHSRFSGPQGLCHKYPNLLLQHNTAPDNTHVDTAVFQQAFVDTTDRPLWFAHHAL